MNRVYTNHFFLTFHIYLSSWRLVLHTATLTKVRGNCKHTISILVFCALKIQSLNHSNIALPFPASIAGLLPLPVQQLQLVQPSTAHRHRKKISHPFQTCGTSKMTLLLEEDSHLASRSTGDLPGQRAAPPSTLSPLDKTRKWTNSIPYDKLFLAYLLVSLFHYKLWQSTEILIYL